MADSQDDEREEELSSIVAIFPELTINPSNPFSASLELPVTPATPLLVRFPPTVDGTPHTALPNAPNAGPGAPQNHVDQDAQHLSHLPPLQLQIDLPDGYPEEKPPAIKLTTTPPWLPSNSLQELEKYIHELWEEYGHMQVVFAYIDYLQQAAERGFDLASQNDGILDLDQAMKIAILDFDITTKKQIFNKETFDCGVCLDPKKGSMCYRLQKCGHVFCCDCLKEVYNNAITEGDIASVKCLEFGCGVEKEAGARRAKKPARTLGPNELLQIPLERAMVQRYVDLKRKKKLESDQSTIYCPREWCQGPARSEKHPKRTLTDLIVNEDSDSEPEDIPPAPAESEEKKPEISHDRLRVCEDCNYAFCRVCLSGWHGEFVRCWPRSGAELTEEEQASYDYIRLHTSPCPTCQSPCQKTHGCNHMNCYQCNTHFCYLCSMWLDPQNPYQHFNAPGKPCYQRLWELEEGDNAEGAVPFAGVRGWEAEAIAAAAAEAEQELPGAAQPVDPLVPVIPGGIVVNVAAVDADLNAVHLADIDDGVQPNDAELNLIENLAANEDSSDEEDFFWDHWADRAPAFERRQPGRPHQPRRPALGGAPIRRGPAPGVFNAQRPYVAAANAREGNQRGVGAMRDDDAHDDDWNDGDEEREAQVENDGEIPLAQEERVEYVVRQARERGRRRGRGRGGANVAPVPAEPEGEARP
jgi:E3 ubiquitin-protein ligase RNF14